MHDTEAIGNAKGACVVWHSLCAAWERHSLPTWSRPSPVLHQGCSSPHARHRAPAWLQGSTGAPSIFLSFHPSVLPSIPPSIHSPFHLSNLPSPHSLTLPHSAHSPVSHRSECQFVPSLTARLKSNHHGQGERNILQICNSLQHWTCSNVSLLEGRKEGRHVQTVV